MYAEVATLQAVLEGVALPASKRELVRYAREQGAGAEARLLERISDREYSSLDEVGEAIAPVQPRSSGGHDELPREESDRPPGGDDYVRPRPTSGAIRVDAPPENPPKKAIEKQTKAQTTQQKRQQKMLDG